MKYILILLILLVILWLIAGWIYNEKAINMVKRAKEKAKKEDHSHDDVAIYTPGAYSRQPYLWYETMTDYEDWHMENEGFSLHAIAVEQKEFTHDWVLICHGYGNSARRMGSFADGFFRHGFNVLSPDARAHGESSGTYTTMGFNEKRDILKWIDRIIEKDKDCRIMLFGLSMGASTVMFTCGERLPANVKGAIADCGYSNVWKEFYHNITDIYHMPGIILQASNLFAKLYTGVSYKQGKVTDALKHTSIPMLFIHGKTDTFVPFAMLQENFDACASAHKEKLAVDNAAHGRSSFIAFDLYWQKVEEFLKYCLS